MATPYASGIQLNGASSSFVLNESGANVDIVYDGGATIVNMGVLGAGTHSFDATLGGSWEIVATKSSAAGWSQFIPDGTATSFYAPCGVSINKDPSSLNFGKVYVSETQTATTGFGRSVTSGIYLLRADGVDVGFATGGVDWTSAGNSSPFKSTIGPDGHLYVTDFSNDLVYEFNNDLSVATALIDASNKTAGQYVEGVHVEGTQAGGDRKIYLVDSHYSDARRGLISYDLGANATATPSDTGTQVIGPDYFAFYPRDVARDSNGDWYMNQYRYDPNQAPAISKFDGSEASPINNAIWETDISLFTGAYCIDLNEDAGVVAYGSYYDGNVYIFDTDTGAFVGNFDAGNRVRELAFDAAGNLVTVDNSVEWARFWSPGGYTEATTAWDGTQWTFTVIPEPSSLSLLALGGLALLLRRRQS